MNIVITGGASGLGLAITKLLAQESTNKIYFTYCISKQKAAELELKYPNSSAIQCDFGKHSDVYHLIDQLPEIDIDVLINNAYAGDITPTYFHKLEADDLVSDFTKNILPVVEITQAAIKIFRKKKFGKIITILSAYLANTPPTGLAKYVAGKAYLKKLTKVWATENIRFNITSNTVSPSFMLTNLNDAVDERIVEQMIDQHPLKKLLSVEEAAQSVQFLVQASQHINGIDLLMNAGSNLK